MKRTIQRSYEIHQRDVHEAVLAWLRSKDMPVPTYIGDTPTCKWIVVPNGLKIEWTEEDETD